MDRIDSSLIALRRIVRSTELFGKEIRQITGVTPTQFRVLQIIGEQGRATAKAISTRMRVSQGTVTSLVDKLVRDGLVARQKSALDRRQTDIILTRRRPLPPYWAKTRPMRRPMRAWSARISPWTIWNRPRPS